MFSGFSSDKTAFTRLPETFFNQLLPQIDHLGELKVTLYALWKIEHSQDELPYLRQADFLADERFSSGLAATPEGIESTLSESLRRAVARGMLLVAEVSADEKLYFLNSPKGRAAVAAFQRGEWRPQQSFHSEATLAPDRPNIFQLYEENIGPLTPILAETLRDAEEEYPSAWIAEALRIAVEKNVRNWRYVEAILRRWQERGYDVREDRRDTEESAPEDYRRYSRGGFADFIARDE